MEPFLAASAVIDWNHPAVLERARVIRAGRTDAVRIARGCFEWVRDAVRHSTDYQLDAVTCAASDVLEHRSGYCYAKSHLLAALLRANGIPAAFCYQRLSMDDGRFARTICRMSPIRRGRFAIPPYVRRPGREAPRRINS
jgi:transglutaminase-like putative cysteine protease